MRNGLSLAKEAPRLRTVLDGGIIQAPTVIIKFGIGVVKRFDKVGPMLVQRLIGHGIIGRLVGIGRVIGVQVVVAWFVRTSVEYG